MENAEMNVLRFSGEDVIATSGCGIQSNLFHVASDVSYSGENMAVRYTYDPATGKFSTTGVTVNVVSASGDVLENEGYTSLYSGWYHDIGDNLVENYCELCTDPNHHGVQ